MFAETQAVLIQTVELVVNEYRFEENSLEHNVISVKKVFLTINDAYVDIDLIRTQLIYLSTPQALFEYFSFELIV